MSNSLSNKVELFIVKPSVPLVQNDKKRQKIKDFQDAAKQGGPACGNTSFDVLPHPYKIHSHVYVH
jgi:hypothetical protein